jgi:hypothetical protein
MFVRIQQWTSKKGSLFEGMMQQTPVKLMQNLLYGDTVEISAEFRLGERGKPENRKLSRCF